MKRTLKTISFLLIICLIPFSLAKGQDKKSEQKIKIIISDASGTKVIIDTLIKDGNINDSIRLKDGRVILIGHPDDIAVMKHDGDNEHMFVTVTSDGKETKKDVKTITIVSSDSVNWSENGEGKVIVMSSASDQSGKEGVKKFDMFIANDEKDSSLEKTRYVIAKDGIVVTVEGTDEAKVKDLIKEIENKMGVKSGDSDKKETVKIETTKSIKK